MIAHCFWSNNYLHYILCHSTGDLYWNEYVVFPSIWSTKSETNDDILYESSCNNFSYLFPFVELVD